MNDMNTDNQTTPTPEENELPPEQPKDFVRRWAALIACTLVLIGTALLAAEAIRRTITVTTRYDEVVQIDIEDLYGSWRYAGLAHQWAGSSSTGDYIEETMTGTVFGITEQRFLASGGVEWAVEHPQYALHALEGTPGAFDDVKQWLGEDVLGYYAILSSGGTVQPYRIYFSRDGRYWITSFTNDTADGSVILYDIYAMEKAE